MRLPLVDAFIYESIRGLKKVDLHLIHRHDRTSSARQFSRLHHKYCVVLQGKVKAQAAQNEKERV